jgi:hypothetical protein
VNRRPRFLVRAQGSLSPGERCCECCWGDPECFSHEPTTGDFGDAEVIRQVPDDLSAL